MSAKSIQSVNRNGHLPVATTTNGSGAARSVKAMGIELGLPFESIKYSDRIRMGMESALLTQGLEFEVGRLFRRQRNPGWL